MKCFFAANVSVYLHIEFVAHVAKEKVMRVQGVMRMPWVTWMAVLVVCTFVPACRAGGVKQPVPSEQQKRVERMQGSTSPVRVGTFDSRALALAYYRSDTFNRYIKELKAKHEKAKAAGDAKRVKKLEGEGEASQELAHKQGFGTWPVDNILKKISKEIPRIAKKSNVDVIVSKWAMTYQRPGVKFVDVTDLMVKPFNPDKKTQEVIREIRKQKPVPLEKLNDHQE